MSGLSVGKAWVDVQIRLPHIKTTRGPRVVVEQIEVRARSYFFTRKLEGPEPIVAGLKVRQRPVEG